MGHNIKSFRHAGDGIIYTFFTQPNMRFHVLVAIFTLGAGVYFQLSKIEWLVITFTILLMITAEMANTAIESMIDLITQEKRQHAKIAKDVSAGMVLVNAVGSVVVGLIIFGPYLLALFRN